MSDITLVVQGDSDEDDEIGEASDVKGDVTEEDNIGGVDVVPNMDGNVLNVEELRKGSRENGSPNESNSV
jgi:hypothetical protein